MDISLYRRYRPQKFSEVAGQSATIDVITRSVEHALVGHAYLFSGPRGCGKTTVARLLAKALNCLSPTDGYEPCCECKNCLAIAAGESLDVVEIDGASNNSVDEVRELKSHVALAPFSARYKVYIIDEVHMLSIAAFNALLKTLEEPPGYVVFILATTEAHKVPVTIRSRCQHLPFRRIETQAIYNRLAEVCAVEKIACALEALWEIARQADGALRDALSMLEQVAGLGREEILLADVEATLGQGSRPSLERWLAGWHQGDAETFLELEHILAGGASQQRFMEELFSLVRDLWLAARWQNVVDSLDLSDQEKEYLQREAPLWEMRELESIMSFLSALLPQVRMGLRSDVLSGLLLSHMVRLKDGPLALQPLASQSLASQPLTHQSLAQQSSIFQPAHPKTREQPAQAKEALLKKEEAPLASSTPDEDTKRPTQLIPRWPPAYEPLDSSEWKNYPEDRWSEALKALHEKEFVLYCGVMEARPFVDEMNANRLVLDFAHRYCYEVMKLDRNRSLLKNFLAPFCEGTEVVLRFEDFWTSCEVQIKPDARQKSPKKRSSKGQEAEPKDFVLPEPEPDKEKSVSGGVPFDGLVREVARWLQGDVIMVRRGGEEEEEEDVVDEIPNEE